jgi:glutamine synthetase
LLLPLCACARPRRCAQDNEVKFVDFRFTDTRGKEQHVTVPVSHFDEDKFTERQAFDGSSIAGWKGINESDMMLMPDAGHGQHRPVLRGAHADPALRRDRAGHDAGLRARSALARQARRGLSEVHRHRRHRALFGPENEFFIFDSVRWNNEMSGCFV